MVQILISHSWILCIEYFAADKTCFSSKSDLSSDGSGLVPINYSRFSINATLVDILYDAKYTLTHTQTHIYI